MHGQLHLNRHTKVVIRNIAVLVQEVRCYAHIAGANEIQISESVRRQIFRSGNPTGIWGGPGKQNYTALVRAIGSKRYGERVGLEIAGEIAIDCEIIVNRYYIIGGTNPIYETVGQPQIKR